MAEKTTGGKRVFMRPPKPVKDMTPEEKRAFAEQLYDSMQAKPKKKG